jgi:hypothetical protein
MRLHSYTTYAEAKTRAKHAVAEPCFAPIKPTARVTTIMMDARDSQESEDQPAPHLHSERTQDDNAVVKAIGEMHQSLVATLQAAVEHASPTRVVSTERIA